MNSSFVIKEERLTAKEYIDFLKRSDLGSQYPEEHFEERIERLVRNVNISLAARDETGRLTGVLFALSDFAYWMFITDLGVDRDHVNQGIGRALVRYAHELASGEKNIIIYLAANENAVGFYEALGMKKAEDVMTYNKIEYTEFTVR